jgi:hypothetical protein
MRRSFCVTGLAMTNDKPIWKRLPSDTDKSFEAFALYRDMGASRSLKVVAEKLQKSEGLIGRWSRTRDWSNRVAAYDASLDEKALDANAEKQRVIRENAYADYEFLRKAIDKTKKAYLDVEFAKVPTYEISNLVELMKKADDYARRAVGLPDKITEQKNEHTGKDGGAIQHDVSMRWEELMNASNPDTDSDPFA